jgi:hypothetical protein
MLIGIKSAIGIAHGVPRLLMQGVCQLENLEPLQEACQRGTQTGV